MFRSITKETALLITISSVIIQQLVAALAIEQSAPATVNQSIEPKRQVPRQVTNVSVTTNSQDEPLNARIGSIIESEQNMFRQTDSRRPVWNMAHMVNSIKELDYRLAKGANAIEVDVTFGKDGDPLYTYHGPPCDCWRHCHQQEDFNEYLRYVRDISMVEPDGIGKNLSVMLLDLKLDYLDHKGKAKAGIELAKSIIANLFPTKDSVTNRINTSLKQRVVQPLIGLILSVNHVTDIELIHNFLHQMDLSNSTNLMSNIGFDVGMNDDLQMIESMWKRFGNTLNLWQGDGFTNCFSPFYNLERLSKALQKRDQLTGFPRKVYQWTIDLHERMREALRMGVDAVMTNHPERLLAVLQEPEISRIVRLATRDDNPFKKIVYQSTSRSGETARHQRSATSHTSGGFLAALLDIFNSWVTWLREIPLLSLPTTSRFLPSSPKRGQKQAEKRTRPGDDDFLTKTTKAALSTAISSIVTGITDSRESTTISDQSVGENNQTITTTTPADQTPPYEGPKWYTSLASNLLVSALKLIMPENS